jgi:hypothetical protein
MKVREIKEVFGYNFVGQYARALLGEKQTRVQRFQAPKDDLEALDLVTKSLYVTSTFMRLSPGGHMSPGRNHKAEKSGECVDETLLSPKNHRYRE